LHAWTARHLRIALIIGCTVASLTVAGAWYATERQLGQLNEALALTQSAPVQQQAPRQATAAPQDYALALPARADTAAAVQAIQQAATQHGVAFISVQVSEQRADGQRLGHTDLALRLNGRYAAVKALLADVLSAEPGRMLQHLTLRRADGAAGSNVEAAATLRLWTRPALTPESRNPGS
jgi:Tfp pilus assembly protein PilO